MHIPERSHNTPERPTSDRMQCFVETSGLHQDIGPGGTLDKKVEEDKRGSAESNTTCRDGPHSTQEGPMSVQH